MAMYASSSNSVIITIIIHDSSSSCGVTPPGIMVFQVLVFDSFIKHATPYVMVEVRGIIYHIDLFISSGMFGCVSVRNYSNTVFLLSSTCVMRMVLVLIIMEHFSYGGDAIRCVSGDVSVDLGHGITTLITDADVVMVFRGITGNRSLHSISGVIIGISIDYLRLEVRTNGDILHFWFIAPGDFAIPGEHIFISILEVVRIVERFLRN